MAKPKSVLKKLKGSHLSKVSLKLYFKKNYKEKIHDLNLPTPNNQIITKKKKRKIALLPFIYWIHLNFFYSL